MAGGAHLPHEWNNEEEFVGIQTKCCLGGHVFLVRWKIIHSEPLNVLQESQHKHNMHDNELLINIIIILVI